MWQGVRPARVSDATGRSYGFIRMILIEVGVELRARRLGLLR
ncbi:helix-turn-helix domain-containing protein [Streptomyces sp. NEAU-YJ-81]